MEALRRELQMHEEMCRLKDKQIKQLLDEIKRLRATLLFVRAANAKRPTFAPPPPPKKKIEWVKDKAGKWVPKVDPYLKY